jgi:hypothetical protein
MTQASKLPHVKKPCRDCPFRKDSLKGWLGRERMTEILDTDSFACHKTTNGNMNKRRQCAGHMLINGHANQFVRLATALNLELDLSGRELIFNTKQECIEHHDHDNKA